MKKKRQSQIQKKRAQAIERAMRLVWSSLESHLPYTHEKHWDSPKFHRECVSEYVEILSELNKLW